MADNTTLNSMTGGDVIAADDIGGIKFQRIKLVHGADGVNDGDSATANPFPVDLIHAGTVTEPTVATLANGATFTSAIYDTSHLGKTFNIAVVSDKAGYVTHEESLDNFSTTMWSHVTEYKANEYYHVDHASFARYSRFKFTNNSGSAQTSFQFSIMQCIFPQTQVLQNAYDMDTTQTVLAGAATYTTKTFNTKTGGPALTFVAVSDQAATLYLDESVDGVTWDIAASAPYPGGGYVFNEMHVAHANFFRVRFVNGATLQTYFRMQLIQRFNGIPWMIKLDPNQAEVYGNKTSNTAIPGGDNFGTLPATATAAAPSHTESYQVTLSTTLNGDTRVTLDGESVPVTGTFWQTTQPVSATDLDIRNLTSTDTVTVVQATGTNLHAVVDSGTVTTVTTVGTLTGGGVAHDAADSGNPIKVGAKVETQLSTVTIAADADRTDLYADSDGVQYVKGFSEADLLTERVADTGGTSTAFTNFGATASTRNLVYTISVFNASATAGYVDFRDGAAGAILFTVPAPAGGGAILSSNHPIFKTTANTALAYDVSGALTTVYISISGRKSKVA